MRALRWEEYGWSYSASSSVEVFKLAGFPFVTWPSGRVTREAWGAAVLLSAAERHYAIHESSMRSAKEELARRQADTYIRQTERCGYWVRRTRKGRQRARRFASIAWTA